VDSREYQGGKGYDSVRLAHIDHFPPFAIVKEGKSEGLAVEILDTLVVGHPGDLHLSYQR